MSKKEKLSLSFFLTRALFLGGGLANIITLSHEDSWLSAILGIIIGIIFIILIHYTTNNINTSLANYIKENNIINIIIKVLLTITSLAIIIICLLAITSLLDNYYLVLTPPWLLSFSFIFICIYSIHKGFISFIRVTEVLFPICFIVIITKTLMLTSNMHFNNFLPILNNNYSHVILASFNYATLSTIPFLFLIDEKISLKNSIKNYLWGTLSTFIIIISVTAVLGYPLMEILSFPEYAILRKIEFLDFIENIENIIAFIWFVDLYVLLTTSAFCIKKISNNKITITFLIIIALIFNIYIINNYNIVITIYNSYIYILSALLIIIIIFLAIKKKITSS